MGDRKEKGVVHIKSEDSGFHIPHESDLDFVSKATAHELGSNLVSDAKCSSEDKINGEKDCVSSPDDNMPTRRRGEVRSMNCGRRRTSSSAASSRGTTSAHVGDV